MTGIIDMMVRLIESLGQMAVFMSAFGAIGAVIIVMLTVRIVKWVANR